MACARITPAAQLARAHAAVSQLLGVSTLSRLWWRRRRARRRGEVGRGREGPYVRLRPDIADYRPAAQPQRRQVDLKGGGAAGLTAELMAMLYILIRYGIMDHLDAPSYTIILIIIL
jgi:hypothetical protein